MRLRRLMALLLSVVVLASAVPLSVMGRNVVAYGGNDLDGLPIHSTKVYDGYKNIGGYTRPSAQTILNDYKNSSPTAVRLPTDSSSRRSGPIRVRHTVYDQETI